MIGMRMRIDKLVLVTLAVKVMIMELVTHRMKVFKGMK